MRHRLFPSGALAALLLALAAFSSPLAAQTGKITGIVTDRETGQPLAGAQIIVEGTGRMTLSQENGRYFLLNIPPGTYTVTAQLIGYATVRHENVQVSIDVTRTVDFALPSQAVALEGVVAVVERVPLVELTTTGTSDKLTAEDLEALPISDINGALELKAGFLQVASNTDVVAFAQERQGVTPLRIRGGRGSETLTLIDGIPVNNFVLGGQAVNLSRYAAAQADFVKGGFEPQYGNALSGFINIATREGGTELAGAIEYRTRRFGGLLGHDADKVADHDVIEGYISGPVPGTNNKLRFMIAGRQDYGPDRVLEFDDDVFVPSRDQGDPFAAHALDVIPGWRAMGFDNLRDAFTKLTYYVTPAAKLSASWLTYERQTKNYDFRWQFAGLDPVEYMTTPLDSAFYGELGFDTREEVFLVQNSLKQTRNLYVLRWDHTLNRAAYQIVGGLFDQKRVTCNVAQGLCLRNIFEDPNFDNAGFVRSGANYTQTPTSGTDRYYGGEKIRTWVARADVQSQVTDHHNLRAGVFFQQHDITYDEWECGCVNQVNTLRNFWKAKPWDAAFYLQDNIEYDFITIRLGFRLDYGRANGKFLADPMDPTNGTTALDVCARPEEFNAPPLDCTDIDQRRQAAEIAAQDDFAEAKPRVQFSPRIGVNLPVTENANLFFNFGRFSQNPLLHNLFRHTNVGTPDEGTTRALELAEFEGRQPFLGNPNLKTEETTSYEVGYMQEIGENYAFTAVAFAKDQFGLTGVRAIGVPPFTTFDPGATYGTNNPRYLILVNGDFATTRGIELGLRKRLANHWGFELQYQWSRSTTNAAEPERERERIDFEGDPLLLVETLSEVDRPHVFTGVFRFAAGNDVPEELGSVGRLLRNTRATLTVRAGSGYPYTPITNFNGIGDDARLERNSGRAPSTFTMDLRAEKDLRISNVDYTFFVQVNNLLDTKYCTQVFPTTGDCAGGSEDQLRRRVSNGFNTTAPSTAFDHPEFFGDRRAISAGVRVNF